MLKPVSQVTGGRRYSFNIAGSTGNLFQRCYSEQGRHNFASHSRTAGPNVWLDCYSKESTNDDGPHHRWATGLLFDNISSFALHVENRQGSGTGHGWSGAQTLFWNSMAEGIRVDAPLGAMNWTIGSMGEKREGRWTTAEPFGWWESHGVPVELRSLYLHQLRDRLGATAVENVTIPQQRAGRIWGLLAAWAGEGRLADTTATAGDPSCATGIQNDPGIICRAASCESCGGPSCDDRPDGASACSKNVISVSGRSCQVYGPPCIADPEFAPLQ